MVEAFGLGLLGASSLLLAGLLACWIDVPARLVGILAGFGAGALIAFGVCLVWWVFWSGGASAGRGCDGIVVAV